MSATSAAVCVLPLAATRCHSLLRRCASAGMSLAVTGGHDLFVRTPGDTCVGGVTAAGPSAPSPFTKVPARALLAPPASAAPVQFLCHARNGALPSPLDALQPSGPAAQAIGNLLRLRMWQHQLQRLEDGSVTMVGAGASTDIASCRGATAGEWPQIACSLATSVGGSAYELDDVHGWVWHCPAASPLQRTLLPALLGDAPLVLGRVGWLWTLGAGAAAAVLAGLEGDGALTASSWASCVAVPSRASADDVVRLALHAGCSAVARQAGRRRWLVAISQPTAAEAAPVIAPSACVRQQWYDGRVWCVAIPSGLIVVRRRLASGEACRPVIVGNCTAIKDGLMVQAVSHRYRRKMTTAIYFAPMPISTSLAHNPTAPINLPPGVLAAASGTPVLSHLTHHLLPTSAGLVTSSASLFPDPLAIRVAECAAAAAEAQASAAAAAAAAELDGVDTAVGGSLAAPSDVDTEMRG